MTIVKFPSNPIKSEFLETRTASSLIQLLEELGQKNTRITDKQLDELLRKKDDPVEADYESLFEFDDALWRALPKFGIRISWKNFLSGVKKADIKNNSEEEKSASSVIPTEINQAIKNFIEARINYDEKFRKNSALPFFSELDEILIHNNLFSNFTVKSKELSRLLLSFLSKETSYVTCPDQEGFFKNIYPEVSKNRRHWEWLLPSIFRAYQSHIELAQKNKKEKELELVVSHKIDVEIIAAAEMKAIVSISLISIIAQTNWYKLDASDSTEKFWLSVMHVNKEHPILKLVTLWFPLILSDDQGERSLEGVIGFLMFAKVKLLGLDTNLYLSKYAYEALINWFPVCTISDEVGEDVYEDQYELEKHLYDLFVRIYYAEVESKSSIGKGKVVPLEKQFNFEVKKEELVKFLEKNNSNKLSNAVITFHLFYRPNYSDCWEYPGEEWSFFNELEKLLVKNLNDHLDSFGMPPDCGFRDLDSVISSKEYFGSISTLAIALNEESGGHVSASFTSDVVRGAQSIVDAGYPEHALVFLGYAIIRSIIWAEPNNKQEFSVAMVNKFISVNNLWKYIPNNFMPALLLCNSRNETLTLGVSLWIKNILDRYEVTPEEKPIDSRIVEKINEEKLPDWFDSDDKSLLSAIQRISHNLDKGVNLSEQHWRLRSQNYNLREALNSLSQSLEKSVCELFLPLFEVLLADNFLYDSFNRFDRSAQIRRNERIELGWIQFFIKACQSGFRRNQKDMHGVIDKLRKIDKNLAFFIEGIGKSNDEVLRAFGFYREIDNMLSHKDLSHQNVKIRNQELSYASASFLFHYATRDFRQIYNLMHR